MADTKEKILITSALPYANGPLHFGHIAGAYLPADCYARFERLKGSDVLYVCGSDEHGVAITLSAEMAGRTPREHVDHFHSINTKLFETLELSFDHYSRTTWEGHVKPSHQYFTDLLNNGFIEEKVTDQLYSEEDEKFLADRYVLGTCPFCAYEEARGDECGSCGQSYEAIDLKNPRSKITGASLQRKATKHWFLLLDKFKDKLTAWIDSKNWKPNVVNFVKSYIDELRPRAITRDMNWGIPVPLEDAEGKVLYVWFEAPIGYISSSQEWAIQKGDPDLWKQYWCDEKTKLVHFIGKDNIPFHAVIFPAMTMGQNQAYKLVDDLPANEFYKLEGKQFSKSDAWYIDIDDFFSKYSADQIRYAIAANAPETSDSEFTWKDFQNRCNADLLGKYGNLANRVLVFAHKQCGGKVPELLDLEEMDREFQAKIQELTEAIATAFSQYHLRRACRLIMELAQAGNVYFNDREPWKDSKSEEKRSRMETTIALCLECLKTLALVSSPVIPESAQKVWEFLGFESKLQSLNWEQVLGTKLVSGQELKRPEILFKKIEDEQVEEELTKLQSLSKKQEEAKEIAIEPIKDLITFDDFCRVDLRVGQVLEAEEVSKSKKLLKLRVDLGSEVRTIVSGIREFYQADKLSGSKVIVVANLKPAKIMGIESEGMILAGAFSDQLKLAGIQDLPPGATVS
ncbi:MAG: methionine--tRNA ligase [Waddliaceae bacterium]|nr:methionine--tRNA ligase [Waddliaceae bacterium]